MGRSKVNGIFNFYFVMGSVRGNCDLSLDRPLEQRLDNLALEQHKNEESGYQDQDGAGT